MGISSVYQHSFSAIVARQCLVALISQVDLIISYFLIYVYVLSLFRLINSHVLLVLLSNSCSWSTLVLMKSVGSYGLAFSPKVILLYVTIHY